jgi:hypothetical protein
MKRIILIYYLIFLPSSVFAANGTTINKLSLYETIESIGVRCAYTGDDNKNMTATVEYQESGGSWITAHSPLINNSGGAFDHQVITSLFELKRGTKYNVRVIFNDPDGVVGTNPAAGSSTTWSHDQPTVGSSCNNTVSNWSELNNALSLCNGSTGTIILDRSGNYSGSADRTIATNGSGLDGFIKIVAGKGVTAYFSDQVKVTGDYLWFDNIEFRNSNYNGSNSEHGLVPDGAQFNLYTNCTFLKNIYLTGNLLGTIFSGNKVTSGCIEDGDCTEDPPGPGGNNCFQNNSLNPTRNGIVIQNNEIYGCRDGIGDWTTWSEVDIKGNTFHDCYDEALEIEGGNVNVRVWNNYTYNGSQVAPRASLATATGDFYGPMFVWNNIFTMAGNSFYLIKNGGNNMGPYLYYNTFYTNRSETRILQDASGDGAFFTGINNIFRNTTGYWFQADGCNGWLDYNNFDTSNTKSSEKVKWRYGGSSLCSGNQVTYDSLTEFETTSEVGSHNIRVASNLDGSYRPKSSVLNYGIPIEGITKDKDGNVRDDINPTIGAYEYAGIPPASDQKEIPENLRLSVE